MELISLLGSLGFVVNWKKCTSQSTSAIYLGIHFDSVEMQLSLPPAKLAKLHLELDFFKDYKDVWINADELFEIRQLKAEFRRIA